MNRIKFDPRWEGRFKRWLFSPTPEQAALGYVHKHEPGGLMYTSNPPQYDCRLCGVRFYAEKA